MIRELGLKDKAKLDRVMEVLQTEGHDLSIYEVLSDEERFAKDLEISIWLGDFEEEELVGVLRAARNALTPHKATLCIGIRNSCQGQKRAPRLFREAVEKLRSKHVLVIHAWIYSNNTASLKFATQAGFEQNGKVPLHHYEKDTAVDDLLFAYFLEGRHDDH